VTVLQAIEGLSDRQAAQYVRTRIDWRYALALPLDETGFDHSILTDFRQRLLSAQAQDLILEPILQLSRERGWLKAGGKQRTDATAVLARVRALSSLESVGESMRATLNALAEQEPAWLQAHLNPAWVDRYVHRFELARFPKAETQRQLLREQAGQDVAQWLASLDQPQTPQAVREVAEVALLRQIFAQHYQQQGQQVHWRDGPVVSNEPRLVSPYDQEARSSRKRDRVWLGYKVHLTETCDQDPACPHLITHVETTPATLPDTEVLGPIQEQLRAKELAPAEHYVDQGYPSGPQLVRQAQLGTQIIGPVGQDPSWQERAQCTRGQGGRTLTLRPPEVHAALLQRRAVQSSPAFVQQYARRAGIEGRYLMFRHLYTISQQSHASRPAPLDRPAATSPSSFVKTHYNAVSRRCLDGCFQSFKTHKYFSAVEDTNPSSNRAII
jgi:IS5 family transposase